MILSHSPNLLKIRSFPLDKIDPSDASPVPPPPPILWVKSENFCIREPGASVSTPGNLLVIGLVAFVLALVPPCVAGAEVGGNFPSVVAWGDSEGMNSGRFAGPRTFLCWSEGGTPLPLPAGPPPLPPRLGASKLFLCKTKERHWTNALASRREQRV